MFCVCLLTIFLIKLLLELDQAYCGICLYFHLYSHLYLMFCICLLTISLIMLLLVILSQISKQPCGSSVAWSECRIVQEASAHSVWDTCVYLDSQLQNLYFCICNMKLISISSAICIWISFDVISAGSFANFDHSFEGSWAPANLSLAEICFAVNLIASRPTVPLRTMWPCERPGTGRRSP